MNPINSNNVDPAEISQFSDQAAHWWDKEGPFKMLHAMNPVRLNYINTHAPLTGKHVIDIGCGGGLLTEGMALMKASVTGIDMSEAALTVAKLHQHESNLTIHYQLSTAEQMAKTNPEQYDVVTCLEMLEHVPDPSSIVKAAATLVKPGGHVFFSTLNRTLKSYLQAIIGAEYILKWLPKQTHDYAKFIRPSELSGWGRNVHLKTVDMTGIHYNLFNKTFSLTEDVAVNYLMHLTK